MRRHNALKNLAVAGGGAEPDRVWGSIRPVDLKEEGGAGQPDPYFRSIDAVPMGAVACREEKQN